MASEEINCPVPVANPVLDTLSSKAQSPSSSKAQSPSSSKAQSPSSSKAQSPSSSAQPLVKQERPEPAERNGTTPPPPTTMYAAAAQSAGNHASLPLPQPSFSDSISKLRQLSAALSAFQRCYDDLYQHIERIRTIIDSQLAEHIQSLGCPISAADSPLVPPANPTPVAPQLEISSAISPPSQPVAALVEILSTISPLSQPTKPVAPQSENPGNPSPVAPQKETSSAKSPPSETIEIPSTFSPSSTPTEPVVPKPGNSVAPKPGNPVAPKPVSSASSKPGIPVVSKPEKSAAPKPGIPVLSNPEKSAAPVPEKPASMTTEDSKKSLQSELEQQCIKMSGKGLRKYLIAHILEAEKLRREVPLAIKRAKDPAKLVLECLGKFYVQGRKAYTTNAQMIRAREASILALECFLLMGMDGVAIGHALKKEAETGSIGWRKRLMIEGGLRNASDIDARGLLLYIGCFGIPNLFSHDDIRDLVRTSKAREFSVALRGSPFLLAKIPALIEGMLKKKLEAEVEAVDIVLTFGLQDKFSPTTILTSFLLAKDNWITKLNASQESVSVLNEVNKKYLADLKSVVSCLENHKIDPSSLLPDWQIRKKILSLEKEIACLDGKGQKNTAKRKAEEVEQLKRLKTNDKKYTKFSGHGMQHNPAAGHVEMISPYGRQVASLLNGGLHGHVDGYSASASMMHHTSGAGPLPENVIGLNRGSNVGWHGTGRVQPSGSYGRMTVDDAHGYMSSSRSSYGWNEDGVPSESFVGQSFVNHHSAAGVSGLYRSPQYEGFAGLPSSSAVGASSRRRVASNLYEFADSVL